MQHSTKKRRYLGAIGLLSKRPTKQEEKSIREKHTNDFGEFEHKNPRQGKSGKREHIPLEKIHKFNDRKFALVGTSPSDQKKVSKIIVHG